jgi:hypothetical protein
VDDTREKHVQSKLKDASILMVSKSSEATTRFAARRRQVCDPAAPCTNPHGSEKHVEVMVGEKM